MKKTILLIASATLTLLIFSCAKKPPDKTELTVFAASSMTETLTEIENLYKEAAPDVIITFCFESSGTLLTQIKEGASCDVFIPAAQKQMDVLDGLDALMPGTRFDLVENRVVMAVPAGNPMNITSFNDVTKAGLIALGNSDVPVGQYSEEIFSSMGLWDAISDKITYASNVKEVTSWLIEAAADCGVIYSTDAFSSALEVVAAAPDGTLNTPVLYPAAVIADSENETEAKAFLQFLKSENASAIFERAGFTSP